MARSPLPRVGPDCPSASGTGACRAGRTPKRQRERSQPQPPSAAVAPPLAPVTGT